MRQVNQRGRGRRDVRLSDVAQAAGVSTASVSRALNSPTKVSQQVLLRVNKAVEDLGYIPSHAGRALASRRSYTVGAVVPTLDNAIFARQIMAFQQRLDDANLTLLLATSEYNPDQEFKQARVLIERGVDALMLVGQKRSRAFYRMLRQADIPFINTWRYDPKSPYPCCGFDHALALEKVVDHLVRLGHTRIAAVTGFPKVNDRVAARLQAIHCALEKYSLNLDSTMIISANYTYESGRHSFRDLIQRSNPPTAIIGGNDILAAGMLSEARHLGIRVPDQVSITGFGDLEMAANTEPPLTTVRTPKKQLGEAAADYLIRVLGGDSPPKQIELASVFCERGTTGPAPT